MIDQTNSMPCRAPSNAKLRNQMNTLRCSYVAVCIWMCACMRACLSDYVHMHTSMCTSVSHSVNLVCPFT